MSPSIVKLFTLIYLIISPSLAFASQQSFEICGTGDSQLLLTKLAQTYMQSHPNISIDVPNSIGSSGGIRKVSEDQCELGRVAREIKDNEKKYNLNYKLFAYSAIVFFTNNNVIIDTLSTKQIVGILSGQISKWQDVGGQNAPIYIAKRERGDSSRTVLEKIIHPLKELTLWAGKTTYTTKETVEIVKRHNNTISFAPLAMTTAQDVRIIKFNNIAPTPENIKTGKYPLIVKLGLVWKDEPARPVQDFLDFVFSPPAQTIIADTGAIITQK